MNKKSSSGTAFSSGDFVVYPAHGVGKVADISKSYNCALARMLRKRLHKLGVYKGVKVVFSPEATDPSAVVLDEGQNKKSNVGTISYMPALFGCHAASVVIRDLLENSDAVG